MTTIRYDLSDLDLELSVALAELTSEAGLQNCHERAAMALGRAPLELEGELHLVRGRLLAKEGLDGAESCDHSWLLWVDAEHNSAVVDPTIAAFFEEHGVPLGLGWELSDEG